MRIARTGQTLLLSLLLMLNALTGPLMGEAIGATIQQPAAPAKDEKSAPKKEELILKPEAKVSFTTDEGTWLSLDVAPDGKTIVFDLVKETPRSVSGRRSGSSATCRLRVSRSFHRMESR